MIDNDTEYHIAFARTLGHNLTDPKYKRKMCDELKAMLKYKLYGHAGNFDFSAMNEAKLDDELLEQRVNIIVCFTAEDYHKFIADEIPHATYSNRFLQRLTEEIEGLAKGILTLHKNGIPSPT